MFHSHRLELITPVCDVFLSLIYPFQWQCLYVPILPTSIAMECVQVRGILAVCKGNPMHILVFYNVFLYFGVGIG